MLPIQKADALLKKVLDMQNPEKETAGSLLKKITQLH